MGTSFLFFRLYSFLISKDYKKKLKKLFNYNHLNSNKENNHKFNMKLKFTRDLFFWRDVFFLSDDFRRPASTSGDHFGLLRGCLSAPGLLRDIKAVL